jgi:hypothetical protein
MAVRYLSSVTATLTAVCYLSSVTVTLTAVRYLSSVTATLTAVRYLSYCYFNMYQHNLTSFISIRPHGGDSEGYYFQDVTQCGLVKVY